MRPEGIMQLGERGFYQEGVLITATEQTSNGPVEIFFKSQNILSINKNWSKETIMHQIMIKALEYNMYFRGLLRDSYSDGKPDITISFNTIDMNIFPMFSRLVKANVINFNPFFLKDMNFDHLPKQVFGKPFADYDKITIIITPGTDKSTFVLYKNDVAVTTVIG